MTMQELSVAPQDPARVLPLAAAAACPPLMQSHTHLQRHPQPMLLPLQELQAKPQTHDLQAQSAHKPPRAHLGGVLPLDAPAARLLCVTGKVALVTGASSGIGRVMAKCLALHGCHVAAAARRIRQLDELVAEMDAIRAQRSSSSRGGGSGVRTCSSSGARVANQGGDLGVAVVEGEVEVGRVMAVALDVTAAQGEVDAVVGRVWDHFGRIDIVVNNAGVRGPKASVVDITDEDFMQAMLVNVRGPWLVTKAVARRFIATRRPHTALDTGGEPTARAAGPAVAKAVAPVGARAEEPAAAARLADITGNSTLSVVNISSTVGMEGGLRPSAAAYSASKAALIYLTKSMAIDLGPYGIRCNCIAPGLFPSDLTDELFKKPWFQRNAKVTVPMQRWGQTHPDITAVLLLLASDASYFVTGTCIPIDGGTHLMSIRLNPRL